MTEQRTAPAPSPVPDPAVPRSGGQGNDSHARRMGPGFLLKLALMAGVNALGLYGLWASAAVGTWGVFTFLLAAVVAADWLYFSRRMIAGKYLYPGLVFLLIYQLFVMAYTGYVAFTNYGDGHNSTKADAIAAISEQNERRVEGSAAYPLAVVAQGDTFGFAVVKDGAIMVGAPDEALHEVGGAVDGDTASSVEGYDVLKFGDVAARSDEITAMRVPVSEDPADGSLRTQDGTTAYVYTPSLQYDEAADTFTDAETGATYTPNDHGSFVSADGKALAPGWRVAVGFENFTAMFTNSNLSGAFGKILVWTFAFALLTVASTFALGLFLAMTFNHPRLGGRRIYRSLLILPYAFPAFLGALVWKGMLNTRFGFINEVLLGGAQIEWLTDPWLAKASVLGVNLWLAFPYMFLISTGALQSLPSDVMESARIDGAGKVRTLRSITLPLLMVSLAPLLISSFAFNFNNFTLVYMLTNGGPIFPGSPINLGATDILISMVYKVAFGETKQYGLASAVSLLIFFAVGFISWLGFRRTRTLEEL